MPDFDAMMDDVNDACLEAFGQDLTYVAPGDEDEDGVPFTGILQAGVEPEDRAPGDGSVYAVVFAKASALAPGEPAAGGRVLAGEWIYSLVRIEEDAGRGMSLLLRRREEDVPQGTTT